MSGPAKCPACGGRLEGVELQRLRTRGAAPRGAQPTSPLVHVVARLFPSPL